MSELNQANIEAVLAAIREKLPDITASLNQCFDTSLALELGESGLAAAVEQPAASEPGVIVSLNFGSTVMLCAIARTLPLPEWYTAPNVSQKARLETLAMEWSLNCVPDDLVAERYVSQAVANLSEAIRSCRPAEFGVCLPVRSAGDDSPAPKMWFVWPVAQEPVDVPQPQPAGPTCAPTSARSPAVAPAPVAAVTPASAPNPQVTRGSPTRVHTSRLLKLPVNVIVKLAEKKVELGQLSGMGPGAIVTFEKSCEDLLDLYVNNQLYCRGEAVKIGEKFGIKITEVGSVEQRMSAVLHSHGR